jgi:hypothetical protein
MALNSSQRKITIIGAIVLLLALLVPPWRTNYSNSRTAGYGFLFAPNVRVQLTAEGLTLDDKGRITLDFPILIVECFFILIATLLGLALVRSKPE